ncbi:MAG TPA: hypothetical protein VJU87_07915 [Gemmatimonadaceae bacterium]|nr:hypothetical protein [Gemmatimonadaceae bacterium]
MHRRAWMRLASALLALWFAVASSDPAAFSACPMLGGAAQMQAAHMQAMHMQGMHMPGMAPAGAQPEQQPSSPRSNQRQCCLGPCVCVSAVLAPASLHEITLVDVLEPGRRVLPSAQLLFQPALVAHARPPTLGPPAPTI